MKSETVKCPHCDTPLKVSLINKSGSISIGLAPDPALAPPPPPVEQPSAPVPPLPTAPPSPKTQRVPFDEWLLSERNIKIALYSGALLLVLAGLIFIGSKWGEFGGPAKFAVISLVTGLLYLGGHLLYQRSELSLAGAAVLGVASGFVPLNFAVLQIYVLGPGGFRDDVMWLIASPICLTLYALTAYWTRVDLFTYLGVGALVNTLTAGLVVIGAPIDVYPLAYQVLFLTLLALARKLQGTSLAAFTRTPFLIASHLAVPVLILVVLLGFLFGLSAGLMLVGVYVGVLFYVATDALFGWWAARWVAAGLLPPALGLTLIHLNFDDTALGAAFMLLSLAYLYIGHVLQRLQRLRRAGRPLYVVAYALAIWVTRQAMGNTPVLTLVLLGDVAILAASSIIHRQYAWVYGAVWLFILPVYLFLTQVVTVPSYQGLLMGLLGLNYLLVGVILSDREVRAGSLPRRGGPFLSATVFLSVAVVSLAWENTTIVTLLLVAVAALYLSTALWLNWSPLLFATLAAIHLAVFTVQESFLGYGTINLNVLDIAYATLTVTLLLSGLWLRRRGHGRWALPLYAVGALDLLGSYGVALFYPPLALVLSAIYAALLLAFAWLERRSTRRLGLIPLLTYLGLILIFIGHFYALDVLHLWRDWPPFTAGLCSLMLLIAWGFKSAELQALYGTPLRRFGLGLTWLPLFGALASLRTPVVVAAFSVVGLTYAAEAATYRRRHLAYLSGAAFLIVYWALLDHLGIAELQAYVLPPGLGLLGLGWYERLLGGNLAYRLSTLLGLSVLLTASFVQSLPSDAFVYALWLWMQSLATIGWGLRTRSRSYIGWGALALLVHTIAQLGPALIELPRWLQLAATGTALIVGGTVFLVKREELLQARRALSEEWKEWQL